MEDRKWVTTAYPELSAMYGANVPNYQGLFLRGNGGQYSYHYGTVYHASAGLGVMQGDTVRYVSDGGTFETSPFGWYPYYPTGMFQYAGEGANNWNGGSSAPAIRVSFNFSNAMPTSNEIRPVNVAVRYLIKAKN